jgi:hypothetical protein
MKRMSYRVVYSLLLGVGFVLSASGAEFSRYSLILERRPFAPVVEVDPVTETVVTVVAPPAFVKDLRVCAITESPAGIRVGFVNIKQKPPQPYYLYVGDSEDGIALVDADYDREGALLRKGSEQYWLYMRGDTTVGGGAPPVSRAAPPPPLASRNMPLSKEVQSKTASSTSANSYAERRRRRLDEMRKRAAASRKESEVDMAKRLQAYQMELIRKGLTPLPIQLTEETDRQLVKEGLLPATEE